MKTRSFALAVALMFMIFTINSALMAQSKDLKNPDNKGKTTVHKIENKIGDVKQIAGKTTLDKKEITKGGEKIAKNENKNSTGKETNKMKNEVKHHKMVTNKTEKKTTEKIKN